MPTKHPRHSVTETPAVAAALEPLRRELGTTRLDLTELLVLGAAEKLKKVRSEREDVIRKRRELADWIREGTVPIDPDAAREVKRLGLIERF